MNRTAGRLSRWAIPGVLVLSLAAVGCSSVYYNTMETFGRHKRDILVNRVQNARDGQEEAKEQFGSALEQFSAIVAFDGGDLQSQYNALKAEYDRSESKARDVSKRIASVEDVAGALFAEWEKELDQYNSADLRRRSEQQLADTKVRYFELISVMQRAESKMQPVLDTLHDQVLYLKHNLNARAIASLEGTAAGLKSDVAALVAEMNKAIAEADRFIAAMGI